MAAMRATFLGLLLRFIRGPHQGVYDVPDLLTQTPSAPNSGHESSWARYNQRGKRNRTLPPALAK